MDHVATSTPINVDNEYTRDYASQFTTTRTFKSKEELIKWVKEVGRSNDITVVVLRSDSGNGKKKPRVTLGCEKSGKCDTRPEKPKTDMTGRRHTGTKKCDCPFRLMGKKVPAGDEWELTVVEGKHNHEAEDTIGKQGHSFQGRLSQEEKSLVKDWLETGKQPKEILEDLKKRDTHNKSTARTIYNECQRFKRLKRFEDQSSQWQQLMSRAEKLNFIEKHRTSPKMDTTSDLFLTHRTSLELLLAFPTVLKIHREGCPPSWTTLQILGVTSTNIEFFVALAITSSRDGSSYEWALSSLRGVMNGYGIAMPHVVIFDTWVGTIQDVAPMKKAVNDVFSTAKFLLSTYTIYDWGCYCTWVIIKLYDEKQWDPLVKTWRLLVASPTEADLDQHIEQLRTEFRMDPEAAENVVDTVLKPYKETFVAAWTDKVMHFGSNIWMSWDSDYFDVDFKYLIMEVGVGQTEQIDNFCEDLQGRIENENAKVKASLKESLENEYNDPELKDPELKELFGTISVHALRLIHEQLAMEVDAGENCSCAIRSTHGLPCAHQISKYRREDRPIPPECINSHWRTLQLKPLRETGEPIMEGKVKRRKLSDEKNTDTRYVLHLPDDIVESERNSPNAGPSIVPSTQDRQSHDEVYDIPSTKLLELVDVSPLVLRTYVLDVKDVPRDGHCGFRAIASLLGITDDDRRPGWKKVRKDLQRELKFNPVHYAHLFGSKQEVDNLLHRLDYFQIPCREKEHWMIMPEMGHIIASCYGVVLILLSSVQNRCFTFFPLQNAPTFLSLPAEIAIGFCDEHFVQVLFKESHMDTHPMPPPAALLTKREPSEFDRHQQQRSREWATRYDARMKQFSSSLQPMVVSHENPIVLDTDSSMDIF